MIADSSRPTEHLMTPLARIWLIGFVNIPRMNAIACSLPSAFSEKIESHLDFKKGGQMAKSLIDEIHVSVYVPKLLPASEADAIWKTSKGERLNRALNRTVRSVFDRQRSLSRCTITVSRWRCSLGALQGRLESRFVHGWSRLGTGRGQTDAKNPPFSFDESELFF
jgi:hypothetical protein